MFIRILFCFSALVAVAALVNSQCLEQVQKQRQAQELTKFTKAPSNYDPLNNPTSNFIPPEDDHE
jgi:hypothetical protein